MAEVAEGEEEDEPEHDEHRLRHERHGRDDHGDPVEAGAADQAQQHDPEHDEDGGDDVPGVLRDPLPADRVPEVVRNEQGCQRDHDRVVEEQHPAGQEADRVVERAAGEHRRAPGLGEHGRALGVGERDDHEQRPGREQHPGREAEREHRHDPEREVDRGADLAVGDRRQRAAGEHTCEARNPACHQRVER